MTTTQTKNWGLKIGDRIAMDSEMEDDPNPIPVGTEGTVIGFFVDTTTPYGMFNQVHVKWENGSTLSLLPNVDSWRKV